MNELLIALDVQIRETKNDQIICDCPFCGKESHLYLKIDTTGYGFLWDCKVCHKMGNLITFLTEWCDSRRKAFIENAQNGKYITLLSRDRGISKVRLLEQGLFWYKDRWIIPMRSKNGNVSTLYYYRPKGRIRVFTGLKHQLWNIEELEDASPGTEVFLCEGFWDGVKTRQFVTENSINAVVVSAPGATTFKVIWAKLFAGHPTSILYDNDEAGRVGGMKVCGALAGIARFVRYLKWDISLPEGYDMRDYLNSNGTLDALEDSMVTYSSSKVKDEKTRQKEKEEKDKKLLPFSDRISFDELLATYSKWLMMTEDMKNGLKVIFSVIYSNQFTGDPLWMHLVGPPGSGKTELLMSASKNEDSVYAISTLSPHSLISGFVLPGGEDPSLIPKIVGKTLIIKDFTEILNMNRFAKDDIYSILRGAFDGHAKKEFGTGIKEYYGYFSIVTGVTSAIYGEASNASLGERFLMYAMNKEGVADVDELIFSAISSSGKETGMKKELYEVANKFLQVRLPVEGFHLPEDIMRRIIVLARIVSLLRATVAKDTYRQTLLYRPQEEVATRLAKQLTKLASCLFFVEGGKFTEDSWAIMKKVTIDTCIGFNLEIIACILANESPMSAVEISEAISLPDTTCREALSNLSILSILEKSQDRTGKGPPKTLYFPSQTIINLWKKADFSRKEIPALRVRRRFTKK